MFRHSTTTFTTEVIGGLSSATIPIQFNIPVGYVKLVGTPYAGNGWCKPTWASWSINNKTEALHIYNGTSSDRIFEGFVLAIYTNINIG